VVSPLRRRGPTTQGDPDRHQPDHDDIDATHAQLQASSVDIDAEIARMGEPVPPMFWIRDPDGNTLLVVEQS
jgi:hypothetical protein